MRIVCLVDGELKVGRGIKFIKKLGYKKLYLIHKYRRKDNKLLITIDELIV